MYSSFGFREEVVSYRSHTNLPGTGTNYKGKRRKKGHKKKKNIHRRKLFSGIYFIMSKKLAVKQYICYYCNWILKEEQIALHSCLNIYDKNEQVLIVDENRRISIQDIQNYEFNKENDGKENYTENDTVENEVAKETSSDNVSPSINKQAIDEDLIYAVQKRPPLYDYRMPLKERSQQRNNLWKKVCENLKGIYTPIEAEKRWNYLKDRYRKSLNSYKKIQESSQRSGSAGIPKNQLIKPSFKHHHLMSFLNDIFEHRSTISSIRMVGEPSTSSAENENSLTELFVNSSNEGNNENEFPLSPQSSGPSCRSTPSLERKKRRSSGNYDEYDKVFLELLNKKPSEPNPIDCFMVRLAEGMRRLPYRERSKLELEFLTRLNEVEEQIGLTG